MKQASWRGDFELEIGEVGGGGGFDIEVVLVVVNGSAVATYSEQGTVDCRNDMLGGARVTRLREGLG